MINLLHNSWPKLLLDLSDTFLHHGSYSLYMEPYKKSVLLANPWDQELLV